VASSLRVPVVLACLMGLAAVGGIAARPAPKAHDAAPRYVLETMVPRQFGDWQELPQQRVQVVNPQTQQLLDKLYSQILTRVYVNSQGYRVMLSIAYGEDQRGGGDLQAHKPEVCYPAQGFKLLSNDAGELHTPYGDISTRRLSTVLGQRKEPVTYWFTVGDTAVKNKFEQRMVEMRLGLTGQLPDGLLFRVSSLDDTPDRAFQAHDAFVVDLLGTLPRTDRTRLSGLAS
jgi:EpsI family protein